MDYIYGKLNEKVKVGVYNGINTPTANTTVDNKQHTIQVDVSKTKGTLTINANGSSSTFNGSEDVIVNIESGGVIAPTVENTTILNSDLFESIKKSNGFYHNESFYIVSYLNNNLIIAFNTDDTNNKSIVQWSLNTEFQNATRDEYAIATNNNLEPNPTGIITQTLSTIKLFGSDFKIVDSSKVPYVITRDTVLTEQVKTDIVNAGRVLYDATTLLYPIDTDGGVGDGLTLVNVSNNTTSITSTTYDWNKDTAFSTAEMSQFQFDTSSVVTTDDYNSLVNTVNNKLTKVTTNKQLYATTNTGEQSTLTYDSSFTPNTIPLRDENGNINVGESPTSSRNAISLMWINPQLEKKFNVAGGTITGNVVVQGNLNVSGTTTTTETETLRVKDNLIVTNDTGTTLVDLSGLAIKTNATDVYGIVYDIATDSVKLGLGQIVDNQFVFNEGEGNAVAIRSDSELLIDNHIIIWDATNHLFKDSGKTINDFASKNTTPSSLNWTNAKGVETSMSFNSSVILTSDNDLNDIKTYGIYQIYTNSTPLNTPKNIVQNAILVVLKSNVLPHCSQLYIGSERYFIRYWNNVGWSSWQELAVGTKVPTIRSLTKDDDLNNLTEYAMYQIYSQSDVANLPKNLPSGLNDNSILNVYQVYSGNTAQVINTAHNALYLRYSYNGGTTWSAWTQTATTNYVDNAINTAITTTINANY